MALTSDQSNFKIQPEKTISESFVVYGHVVDINNVAKTRKDCNIKSIAANRYGVYALFECYVTQKSFSSLNP